MFLFRGNSPYFVRDPTNLKCLAEFGGPIFPDEIFGHLPAREPFSARFRHRASADSSDENPASDSVDGWKRLLKANAVLIVFPVMADHENATDWETE